MNGETVTACFQFDFDYWLLFGMENFIAISWSVFYGSAKMNALMRSPMIIHDTQIQTKRRRSRKKMKTRTVSGSEKKRLIISVLASLSLSYTSSCGKIRNIFSWNNILIWLPCAAYNVRMISIAHCKHKSVQQHVRVLVRQNWQWHRAARNELDWARDENESRKRPKIETRKATLTAWLRGKGKMNVNKIKTAANDQCENGM